MGLLINEMTAAMTSDDFYVDSTPIGLVAVGLAGAEEVQISVYLDPVAGWHNIVTNGKLTASAPELTVSTRGQYRVSKGVTAGAAGVYSV
jgi:hypothetical protein